VPKRGCLGCSFPLILGIGIVVIALTIIGFLTGSIGTKLLGRSIGPDWLHVPTPQIELPPESLLQIGGFHITNTMITAWITIVLIIVLSYFAFRRPKLVPSGLQAFMETVFGWLLNLCTGVAGEKNGRRFFPVMATIVIFVVVNAWLNLLPVFGSAFFIVEGDKHIPLLRGANTDLNVTLALALFSFIAVEYYGIKELGLFRYLKKFVRLGQLKHSFSLLFAGKVKSAIGGLFFGILDVFVGFLETLSEFIRIISFSFRLFGNMIAGEILLLVLAFLVPLTLATPFYGLEAFIGLLQGIVFGFLTLIFINLAVSGHEENHT
jgi:F-type H+-transporting ATPase subunit a